MAKLRSRVTFAFAAGIFLVALGLLYSSLDAASTRRREFFEKERVEVGGLEAKLKTLEGDLAANEALIGDIRGKIYSIVGARPARPLDKVPPVAAPKLSPADAGPVGGGGAVPPPSDVGPALGSALVGSAVCSAARNASRVSSDVQMLDAYAALGFENPDGGVWKQGWDIRYDEAKVTQSDPKLEVVVIPHSHCDPGWIKTFEKYYSDQVKSILDGMLVQLNSGKQLSFIYAEVSFFEMWWRGLGEEERGRVRRLLETGRLEIVTGGWVMTDEANSHFFATVDQLIEGHQWLEQQLGFKPRNHWSIDPFGLSSTMPALLKAANFSTMVIQRVHYRVKQMLAKAKNLEFAWRPLWAGSSDAGDMLTHLFPFYSYDIPHTCGPDPKICCQFDFRRLPGMGMNCPWNVPPQPISASNAEARATVLLDQYRKKAQLYKSNVLLVPLGDDFRYDSKQEWEAQYDNYKRLFDVINSKPEWNAHIRFGTLHDYFTALSKRTGTKEIGQKPPEYATLSGDFFTYADRDDHYWSGYYTSRPFYKRMDRSLQYFLRGAEVAFSLASAVARGSHAANFPSQALFGRLVTARRSMGLFQHHDGVTGTAKDAVVVDYGEKMLAALRDAKDVLLTSTQFLLSKERASFEPSLVLDINEVRSKQDSVPEGIVVATSAEPSSVLVYNSQPHERAELLCLLVDSAEVSVAEGGGGPIPSQLNPRLYRGSQGGFEVSATIFELCFQTSVGPLGWKRYTIRKGGPSPAILATLQVSADVQTTTTFQLSKISRELSLYTPDFGQVEFSADTGLLRKVAGRKVEINFFKYGTVHAKDKSGAYLFLPNGAARPVSPGEALMIVAVRGPLVSSVHSLFPLLRHSVQVVHAKGLDAQSLLISNLVDIRGESNCELAMRVSSDVVNVGRVFYTDLNGFQMIKRKYWEKIPIQGNFYPMPAAAFLEDAGARLSLLSAQPLGVASLQTGELEVILDRRLMQDDNRGLFQGVTDNKVTPDTFRLLLQTLTGEEPAKDSKLGQLSLLDHFTSQMLNHPLFAMVEKAPASFASLDSFNALKTSFPCDLDLVNLRQLSLPALYANGASEERPAEETSLILHRRPVDCRGATAPRVPCAADADSKLQLRELWTSLRVATVERRSLTLMDARPEPRLESKAEIRLDTMEIASYKIKLE